MTRVASTRPRADNQGATSPLATGRSGTQLGRAEGTVDVAQLVRRAASGDKAAWERLVDQFSRLIWAMTRDFKLCESDAADVVQATWLRLLENIHRIEYPERIGSWLATTARHECLRHVTAGKRVMLVQDHDAFSGSSGAAARDRRAAAGRRARPGRPGGAVSAARPGRSGCWSC